jgi:hypothetical protein
MVVLILVCLLSSLVRKFDFSTTMSSCKAEMWWDLLLVALKIDGRAVVPVA